MNTETSGWTAEAELAALTRKARTDRWSPEGAIDWSARVVTPSWLSRLGYVSAVSQLRHAEQATLEACVRLRGLLPETAAGDFLAVQAEDEQRHVAAYDRYLASLGDRAPPDAAIARALAGTRSWNGSPLGLIVAFHLLIEVEAVKLAVDVGRWFPCPLLRAINLRIARDEARHVAFGRIYLRARLGGLAADERHDIHRWVRGLWHECVALDPDNGGLYMRRIRGDYMARRWLEHRRTLVNIGLVDGDADMVGAA